MLSMLENVNVVCNDENVICENVSSKRKRCDDATSAKLWHYHLGHISRKSIERLYKEDILHPLDFSNLNYCINCIKGKYVKKIKKGAKRSARILEIIHMNICSLFPIKFVNNFDSFITLIDDFLRYVYICPIKEQSETLDKFKIFKDEVKNKHDLKIKIVIFDRGGGCVWGEGDTMVDIPRMTKFLDPLRGPYKKWYSRLVFYVGRSSTEWSG
jgi:hypothetical protein